MCGIAVAKKAGFVSGWTTLLNASVAIYLGIYVTPTVVESVSYIADFSYGAMLTAFVVAVILFTILNTIASTVTGDLKIEMPKMIETLGGGAIGFLTGMLLWGFLCLLLEVSPLADSAMVKDTCRDPAEISNMWKGSVGVGVAVLNTVSCQSNAEPLADVVKQMKAVASPKPKNKPAPTPPEETAPTESDPNSSPAGT